MFRSLALTLLAAGPVALLAAPVPPERDEERMRRIYGTPFGPDEDCMFSMLGEKLRIAARGPHFIVWGHQANPAWAMREVEGDFTVEVRVECRKPRELKPAENFFDTFAYAGLLVWPDEDHCLDLQRGWRRDSLDGQVHVQSHHNQSGQGGAEWWGVGGDGTVTDEKPTQLRVTRAGNRFSCSYKSDG